MFPHAGSPFEAFFRPGVGIFVCTTGLSRLPPKKTAQPFDFVQG
jgi:hypothetical protein